ncbi:MAG: hypothetical protein H6719_22330 [Sandaracinaceae bacterium]|nr:hypothetical protein [Sandaracinaceae bacterium]
MRGLTTAALAATLLATTSCGAKTGLRIEPVERDGGMDAGFDAGVDAGFDGGPDAGPECRPFQARATLAGLDVFVLLDSSGSMADTTDSGATKAEAVAAALGDFVSSPDSEGIGVALTFFPQVEEGVPRLCGRDADCGPGGECEMPDVCSPTFDQYCRTDRDCGTPGDTCEPLGYCSDDPDLGCLPALGMRTCPIGSTCIDFGSCTNYTSCAPADYAPEVPIAVLPGAAAAFVTALAAREPDGGTPTAAAIEGTLDRARARRVESPGSKVIVLLATDGFPTECDPAIDIYAPPMPAAGVPLVSSLVRDGAAMGVQTFVVGVFEPTEEVEARANLSAIASAGGTDEALVVTTTEPVADRLLAIFEELRRDVRSCVYAIPRPGALPDPALLEVSLQPRGGEPIPLERRDGPDDCDPMTGGFFFEAVEPGTRPGYAELCPVSCDVASRPDVTVEMQVACPEP